jgi:hypothetical protein
LVSPTINQFGQGAKDSKGLAVVAGVFFPTTQQCHKNANVNPTLMMK